MRLPPDIVRIFSLITDSILPLSPESNIARTLTEEILQSILAPITHRREPWINALFPYLNPKIRALLRSIKYRGEKAPLPALGAIASEEILGVIEDKTLLEGWRDILMVPVPSSSKRLRKRGYNQADRIALAILPYLHNTVQYAPDILARQDRPSQLDVPKEMRHRNVEGAFFALRPEKIHGRYILLIDDVVESGTTLKDARRALIEAGALDVIAVAMAH